MINERIALVMLDGEVPSTPADPHHTSQYYKSVQAFADASVRLCEQGRFKKLQQFLHVAWKLFNEGNDTVRNGIVNIFLYSLSRVMSQEPTAKRNIEPLMPKPLRAEYARLLYVSGL